MQLHTKIICATLNYQRLDDKALSNLNSANLDGGLDALEKFKKDLGIEIESLTIIKKCNAVMVIASYVNDLSLDYVHGRLLTTWDKNSKKGILDMTRDVKMFHNIDALKFLAECAVGLHSVTIGDSQVAAQVTEGLSSGIHNDIEILKIIAKWLTEIVDECKLRTDLFNENTSLERIACELIAKNTKKKQSILLVGYGKSGKLIAKILNRELFLPMYILNRTPVDIKKENLNETFVHYLPFDGFVISNNVSSVVVALDNNEGAKKVVKKLMQTIPDTSKIYFVDLVSPPILNEKLNNIVDIRELSKIAEQNTQLRKNEINKARVVIQGKLNTIINTINKNVGKKYIYKQKNHVLKLDEKKIDLIKQRGELINGIREYLHNENFIEVTTPHIVGISTDPPKVDKGGTINVDWINGTTAFLRQSNQMYKQILVASGVDKVYEIGPFWRKEERESYRHLQESIGLDIELSNPKNLEGLYRLACSIIKKSNDKIVETFDLQHHLSIPEIDNIPVLTYHEAVDMLRENGSPATLGDDLGLVSEANLGKLVKKQYGSDIFVVKDYPDTIKKFYTKNKTKGLTETFDVIVGGWELTSGAIRQTDGDKIRKSMQLSGINTRDYEFYISIVDGAVPHGGFCIGIDRLIAKVLGMDMVQDAVPFPRTYKKLIP